MDNSIKRIFITPGEPAGIGPDVLLLAMQQEWPFELIAVVDPELMIERAQELNLTFDYTIWDKSQAKSLGTAASIKIFPVKQKAKTISGNLNVENASYVIDTLKIAANFCLANSSDTALVTGPVHKGIINQANISFSGHTEWLAKEAQVETTLMLFVVQHLKTALLTTHIPLKEVSAAVTEKLLTTKVTILHDHLIKYFGIDHPSIGVCGLNPHAGENGYLGREEIEIITPGIEKLKSLGMNIKGPYPADTIFTPQLGHDFDAILAMYHDQALPLIKYLGFDTAVNVTLGLPFIRTSVDHGTALDIAGRSGKANAGSLIAAIKLAGKMLGSLGA